MSLRKTPVTSWLVSIVVAVSLLAIVLGNQQIVASIDQQLNENWRGQYDILVLPAGSALNSDQTSGLVDPNFVSTAGRAGISLEQLARIREIADIEVAAPIGLVGIVNQFALGPSMWLPSQRNEPAEILADGPVMLRLSMVAEYIDARNETVALEVTRNTGYAAVGSWDDFNPETGKEVFLTGGWGDGPFAPEGSDLGTHVVFGPLPAFSHSVVAIDPEAEAELLGERIPSYVSDLLRVPTDRQTGDFEPDDERWDWWLDAVDSDRFTVQHGRIVFAPLTGEDPVLIPLVVREDSSARLRITLSVEYAQITQGQFDSPDLGLGPHLSYETVGSVIVDMSDILLPLSSPATIVPWFGTEGGELGGTAYSERDSSLNPMLIGRPDFVPSEAPEGVALPGFHVQPLGVVHSDGLTRFEWPGTEGDLVSHGQVRAYRDFTLLSRSGTPLLMAPIGTFSTEELSLTDTSRPSYVPMGTSPSDTARLDDGSLVIANPSQRDFLTVNAGVFTDLAGGEALRGDSPIDAIRVRVAGVDSYTPENQQRILDIAKQIDALGLQARIVAGSSLTEVAIFVPDYHINADGTTSDLGWVTQEWTSLGAVVQVDHAVKSLLATLSWVSFGIVLLGFVIVLLLTSQRQRRPLLVMENVGWTSAERYRYLIGLLAPTLVPILLAALISAIIPSEHRIGFIAAAVAVSVLAILFGAALTIRAELTRSRARRSVAASMPALALRQVLANRTALTLSVLGTAAVGVVTYLAAISYETLRADAGSTRIADYIFSSNAIVFAILVLSGILIGCLLLFLARQAELRTRARHSEILSDLGFTASAFTRQFLFEDVVVAGISLAAAGALLVSSHLIGVSQDGYLWAGIAVVFAVLVRSCAGWLSTRKGPRHAH